MKVHELQDQIQRLKKVTNSVILAHSYQSREICEVADYTGDSYKLSVDAMNVDAENIIFCGVHFMAETAKILSPDKHVFLASKGAGCPMAEQFSREYIQKIKDKEPDRAVVAYINTTAELKTVCDVCVTSSSALKIVKAMSAKKILFVPDCNLGDYVKRNVKDKDIMLLEGGCPVHGAITAEEAMAVKAAHPEAMFLVHPECKPEVVSLADYVGSTSGIMSFAHDSSAREFIIGTENSIVEHLKFECPGKKFYPLSKDLICRDMKLTTLPDVYNTLLGIGGGDGDVYEIEMDDELIARSRKCIDEMIRLGG